MKFNTNLSYKDRKSKAFYVWDKYKNILYGKILDVGADQCYLKKYCRKEDQYIGIGLGKKVDKIVNLEKEKIPFNKNSFDCVLCLDVLEHLDNIHEVFNELCRVTDKYLIISLPNPFSSFREYLQNGDYKAFQHLKFYGLPVEKPEDRHKWFFATDEGIRFIEHKVKENNMKMIQMDFEGIPKPHFSIKKTIIKLLFPDLAKIINNDTLTTGTLWVVLKKNNE